MGGGGGGGMGMLNLNPIYSPEYFKKRQEELDNSRVSTQVEPKLPTPKMEAPPPPPPLDPLVVKQEQAKKDFMVNAPKPQILTPTAGQNPSLPPALNYASPQDIAMMRQKFFDNRRTQTMGDIAREKAQAIGSINAQQQGASEALQRRFAAMGAGGSGAQISALANLNDQGLQAQRQANDSIGRNEINNLNAAEQEAALQQASGELSGGRAADLAGRDELFRREAMGTDQANKLAAMDLAYKQFEMDKDAQAFNKRLAEITAGDNARLSSSQRAGLLGQGGFLGTGIGGENGLFGTGLLPGGK